MKNNQVIVMLILISIVAVSYSQVLDYSTNIYIKDETMRIRKSYKVLISSSQYRNKGDISIRHSGRSGFKLLKACIFNKNGELVRTVKRKDVLTASLLSNKAFYQDDLISKINLHWNEYPYTIEYSYEETYSDFISVINWTPIDYQGSTTFNSSLEIQIPQDYVVNIDYSNHLQFKEDTLSGGIRKLTWKCKFYELPNQELYAPPIEEMVPYVVVLPNKFIYDIDGRSSTWVDFGEWIYKLNSGKDNLPASEKLIVDSLIANSNSRREIICNLYNYLQDNTIYVNVSIGFGGFKSYPASYVCHNKYGDCKALSTYMKAMLKHAGIDSYYALINTGVNASRIKKSFVSQQFNHIILCIPADGDTLWLENTSNILPFDYLSMSNQDRYALIVNSSNSRLVKTPAFLPEETLETRNYNFVIHEDGIASVNIQAILFGKSFEKFNAIDFYQEPTKKEESIIDYTNLENFNCTNWNIQKVDRNQHYIRLLVEGEVKEYMKTIGNMIAILPIPVNIPKFEKAESRTSSLRFNHPICKVDTLCYMIPYLDSYECQLPADVKFKSKFGEYSISSFQDENSVYYCRQFIINRGDYTLEEYPAFYEFINSIEQSQRKTAIILKPKN